MLIDLHIRNFAIIDECQLEFQSGMTALTGETGAGKSILLDALGLVLGERASSDLVQQGQDRAEITASFALDDQPSVRAWLTDADLDTDDECILRRTLSSTGKSKASINGTPVAIAQLKELGQRLIAIHGQHAHQSLNRSASQRLLLDKFGPSPLVELVRQAYTDWQAAQSALDTHLEAALSQSQRLDLLSFQLQEFDELDIGGLSVSDLEEEHRWRANAEELISLCAQTSEALDSSIEPALATAIRQLEAVIALDPSLREALDLLESAAIQSHEAGSLVSRRLSDLDHDNTRLNWLDSRLAQLHRLAKKHQCSTAELDAVEQQLRDEFDALTHPESSEEQLTLVRDKFESEFAALAKKLGVHRRKQGRKLSKIITEAMQSLNMTGASFVVDVSPSSTVETKLEGEQHQASAHGTDKVTFLVSTNPGRAPAPLSKVASGGELSRISLCIQLATIETHGVATLIFDEVDAGIGGAVAESVGKLMRQVGHHAQVLCVTHLPQVAAQAHRHLQVQKTTQGGRTRTAVQSLDAKQTREEIARMLGGAKLTAKSRQHAKEMLESVK